MNYGGERRCHWGTASSERVHPDKSLLLRSGWSTYGLEIDEECWWESVHSDNFKPFHHLLWCQFVFMASRVTSFTTFTISSREGNSFITLTNGKLFSWWQWKKSCRRTWQLTSPGCRLWGLRGWMECYCPLSVMTRWQRRGRWRLKGAVGRGKWQRMKAAAAKNKRQHSEHDSFDSQGESERTATHKAAEALNTRVPFNKINEIDP